jgi:hypothetical protein
MAEKQMMSIIATTSERISELVIKNGQLIFIHDVGRIALDYNGKRTFYNQVIELETEKDRLEIIPNNGKYYFVIETGIFWRYFNEWKPLTNNAEDVVFIGNELPELGKVNTLYADTTEKAECISVWDEETNSYKVVADKTQTISVSEVEALFKV